MTSTLTIENKPTKNGKTRQFSATLLGYIKADMLWEGGRTDTKAIRPVALWVGGSEAALRPFLANLKTGRKANIVTANRWRHNQSDGQIEMLRSAGYDYVWQKLAGGTAVACAYLHELFVTDPGLIDSATCEFISAPPQWWVAQQVALLDTQPDLWQPVLRHARRLHLLDESVAPLGKLPPFTEDELKMAVALAYHFCTSLDRRTRRPLINSLDFYLQVYLAMLSARGSSHPNNAGWPWARGSKHFSANGLDRLGVAYPAQMRASQEALDEFLVQQAAIYRQYGGAYGTA